MTDLHESTSTSASTNTADPVVETTSDRRTALRRIALGGVGAAAGAVALGSSASAGDQAAAGVDGNAVELGETNTAVDATIIDGTPAAPVTAGPSAFSAGGYVPGADAPFPAGVGGYGDETIPHGLHGSTLDPAGYGAVAANLAPALADGATEVAPSALAVGSVGGSHITFVPLAAGVAGPTPGTHAAGELYRDAEGTLWFTVPLGADPGDYPPSATPGEVRFVKLAGTPTAGQFHTLPVAQRIYDSRELGTPTKLSPGPATTDLDLTTTFLGEDSGFPAGSITAVLNITLDDTEGSGFARIFAVGTDLSDVETSNINWYTDGQILANQATVPVSADGMVTIELGGPVTSATHVIVDLQGYYL